MRTLLIIFITVFAGTCFSNGDSLRKQLVAHSLGKYTCAKPEKRKFLSLKNKSVAAKVNPLTYAAGSLMFIYQRAISEQIQANCNYQLSCSAFTVYSMEHDGLLTGLLLGLDQLMNCFPGVSSDYEPCRINHNGKVINHPEDQ